MAYTANKDGAVTTIHQLAANQMPDVDKVMHLLEPYQTPILQHVYFSNGGGEVVINENGKFSWFENELFPHQTTVSSITGGSSSEDNITVDDGTIFNAGDICLIEATEQIVYIDSVASSEVDITHIDGSTNITAASSGYIKIIGSRNYEYGSKRTAVWTQEVEKYNYLNIFRETISSSGRWQAGSRYTGKSHKSEVKKRIKELKLQVERWFLFSNNRGTATVSTDYRHTYGYGALGMVTTNATSYSGSVTEDGLFAFYKDVFAKGTNKKRHYAGSDQIDEINKVIRDKSGFRVENLVDEYGVDLQKFKTPFGMIELVWNPMMDGKFTDYGLVLDAGEDNVKLRYMANDEKGSRKFRYEQGVETPGVDGKDDQVMMDIGIQITNEETCGWLYQS